MDGKAILIDGDEAGWTNTKEGAIQCFEDYVGDKPYELEENEEAFVFTVKQLN